VKSVAELINTIDVLNEEIMFARSQVQSHDSGHIYTSISWMTDRVFALENEVRALEMTP
jgi:hypothetical protein